jgi:hypothetical protein
MGIDLWKAKRRRRNERGGGSLVVGAVKAVRGEDEAYTCW